MRARTASSEGYAEGHNLLFFFKPKLTVKYPPENCGTRHRTNERTHDQAEAASRLLSS